MAGTVAGRRIDALTGLRWFAALAVFGRHVAGEPGFRSLTGVLKAGNLGVGLFFTLSGFVLAWSHRDGDTPRAFYRRRFARIVPAYMVVLAFMVGLELVHGVVPPAHRVIPSVLMIQAWSPSLPVYYGVYALLWSLSVEVFFYAVFPLIRPALVGLDERRAVTAIVVCAAIPIVLPFITGAAPEGSTAYWLIYIFPPSRLPEFCLGILLAVAVRRGLTFPMIPATAIAAVAFLVAGRLPEQFMWVAVGVIPSALLIVAATGSSGLLARRWVVTLGVWSYAFYLVHGEVINKLAPHLHGSAVASVVVFLPAAIVTAAVLHYVVEMPCERRLRRARPRVDS